MSSKKKQTNNNRPGCAPKGNRTYKRTSMYTGSTYDEVPETLEGETSLYGFTLDEDQIKLRDAIWNPNIDAVFVDSPAGTGKSMVSIATAFLMCEYDRYSNIVYVMHPVGDPQGALPGTLTEKSSVYFESLYQTLNLITNDWPSKFIKDTSMADDKDGMGFITAITDTYLRGSNIGSAFSPTILIVDEAQNFPEFALRKVLTRACEGTKVIVIGHTLQCDLKAEKSGFARCQKHFRKKNDPEHPRFAFCELHNCHRSIVAQIADEVWDDE